ncbi:MAG: ATP-binding cassette domain-containing protein [Rhodospirillaceae bacterium]|nr:ATP-binding cassette domain-containing protein [Rhodospirillaceae bacterium]
MAAWTWLRHGLRLPWLIGAAFLILHAATGDLYDLRLLTVTGSYALMVLGYQLVFGHAGALSLAQGAFFGLGAYATGIFGATLGWPFPATFAAAVALPALTAALVALPALRLQSHYFALATLGLAQLALILAVNWEGLTGGANGLAGVPAVLPGLAGRESALVLLAAVWMAVAVAVLICRAMTGGVRGMAYRLVREAPEAAAAAGIDAGALRLWAFVVGAGLAGAGGAFQAHALRVVSPESIGFSVMVSCLMMAVIGGRTRIAGAILGALLLVHLPEWARALQGHYLLVFGALTLVTIIFAPDGLAGAGERLRARLLPERPLPPPPAAPPPSQRRPVADGAVLEAHGLTKNYGGVRAVDGVDIALRPGEIVGLIGANGSGKSTLANLLTGHAQPDRGQVWTAGTEMTGRPAYRFAVTGIARGFQTPLLSGGLSALDNVAAAGTGQRGRSAAVIRAMAGGALDLVGEPARTELAGTLPPAARRRVEIARALMTAPAALVLDEPAAGMAPEEQEALAALLRRLAEEGLALLVIEHRMDFLLPLAARLVCMDAGRIVAEGPPETVLRDAAALAAYLGGTRMPEAHR